MAKNVNVQKGKQGFQPTAKTAPKPPTRAPRVPGMVRGVNGIDGDEFRAAISYGYSGYAGTDKYTEHTLDVIGDITVEGGGPSALSVDGAAEYVLTREGKMKFAMYWLEPRTPGFRRSSTCEIHTFDKNGKIKYRTLGLGEKEYAIHNYDGTLGWMTRKTFIRRLFGGY